MQLLNCCSPHLTVPFFIPASIHNSNRARNHINVCLIIAQSESCLVEQVGQCVLTESQCFEKLRKLHRSTKFNHWFNYAALRESSHPKIVAGHKTHNKQHMRQRFGGKRIGCSGRDLNPSRWLASLCLVRKANMIGQTTLPEPSYGKIRQKSRTISPRLRITISFIKYILSDLLKAAVQRNASA